VATRASPSSLHRISCRRANDSAWPTHRRGHNWDAIGRIERKGKPEWLLVETKANVEELESDCRAENPESLKLIQQASPRRPCPSPGVTAGASFCVTGIGLRGLPPLRTIHLLRHVVVRHQRLQPNALRHLRGRRKTVHGRR
jgi:hypothetical protein